MFVMCTLVSRVHITLTFLKKGYLVLKKPGTHDKFNQIQNSKDFWIISRKTFNESFQKLSLIFWTLDNEDIERIKNTQSIVLTNDTSKNLDRENKYLSFPKSNSLGSKTVIFL